MPTTRDEIVRAAMELPESERLSIASELLGTLPDDMPGLSLEDEDLLAELDRRANDGSEPIELSDIWKRD
jgi:hypothetical protein